jgi:hypothetical protein
VANAETPKALTPGIGKQNGVGIVGQPLGD